jgi:hypothetical protein
MGIKYQWWKFCGQSALTQSGEGIRQLLALASLRARLDIPF